MAVVNSLKTIREERAPSAEFMLRIAAYFNLLVEDVFTLEEH